MAAVAKKVDAAKARPDWHEIMKKVFKEDRAQLTEWFNYETEAWTEEKFYVSGKYAGKIENDFVSKVP